MYNLAGLEKFGDIKRELKKLMEEELKKQHDPRMFGNGDVFDNYIPDRGAKFYERYMRGEKVNLGWINKTDFESAPINK